jgi:UDP-N-acetylmuramate dehydrogenase
MAPRENVHLAEHCTLGVGGPARFFVEARDEAAVLEALDWARARRLPIRVLGGGSNLVVADEGVDGLVVKNWWSSASTTAGRASSA